MTEHENRITHISLTPDGVQIGYMHPDDVKKNGLYREHTLLVPYGSDYEDEIESLVEAIHHLLNDAIEDMDLAEPVGLDECEDDEEEDQ